MASCAAGMASRVYDQNMELVYTFMVGTWGHLFIANKKEEHKNTCEPTNFHTPLGVLCNIPLHKYAFVYLLMIYPPFQLVSLCDSTNIRYQWKTTL